MRTTLAKLPDPLVDVLLHPLGHQELWQKTAVLLNAKGQLGASAIFNSLKEERRVYGEKGDVPSLQDRLVELGLRPDNPEVQLAEVVTDIFYASHAWKKLVENPDGAQWSDELAPKDLQLIATHPLFSPYNLLRPSIAALKEEAAVLSKAAQQEGVYDDFLVPLSQAADAETVRLNGEIASVQEREPIHLKIRAVLERKYQDYVEGLVIPGQYMAERLGVERNTLYSRRSRLMQRLEPMNELATNPEFREWLNDENILNKAYEILNTRQVIRGNSPEVAVARFLKDWYLVTETAKGFQVEIKAGEEGRLPKLVKALANEDLVQFLGNLQVEQDSVATRALNKAGLESAIGESKAKLHLLEEEARKKMEAQLGQAPSSLPVAFPSGEALAEAEITAGYVRDSVDTWLQRKYPEKERGVLRRLPLPSPAMVRTSLSSYLGTIAAIFTGGLR